jgi:hypothetical protein
MSSDESLRGDDSERAPEHRPGTAEDESQSVPGPDIAAAVEKMSELQGALAQIRQQLSLLTESLQRGEQQMQHELRALEEVRRQRVRHALAKLPRFMRPKNRAS